MLPHAPNLNRTVRQTDKAVQLEPHIVIMSTIVKMIAQNVKTNGQNPKVCDTSKLPYFLYNQHTVGDETLRVKRRPRFTSQEDSWYSFQFEAESTPGPYCGWKD
jgi:hypothetical protein